MDEIPAAAAAEPIDMPVDHEEEGSAKLEARPRTIGRGVEICAVRPMIRIWKNIEHILATFRGAVNLKDIATFWRGGAQYVDQYFGASGRPARGQKKFGI